jgi:hypothetical protein
MTALKRERVGRWLGVGGLVSWLSLWLLLIIPPLRPLFGRHAVPQILIQGTFAVMLSLLAGLLQSKKWWLLTALAAGSLVLLLLGMYST